MTLTYSLSQKQFIDGLVGIILNICPNSYTPDIKQKAIRLLLFIGVLNSDSELVQIALDNGGCPNDCLLVQDKDLLTRMGWVIPNFSSPVAGESSEQSLSSDEAFPHG